jgi:hypothetical protein
LRISAHRLRKLGVQRFAEAGASKHQLMALFGWTDPHQAAVYTKKGPGPDSKLRRPRHSRHEEATKVSHFFLRCRPWDNQAGKL